MNSQEGVVLKEISVKGFKYFYKEQSLNLDYNVIVLIGPIGSGKSSLLEAIEFGLFGTTYDVRKSKIMSISDVVNDFSDELEVKLTLKVDDDIYKIVRNIFKKNGKIKVRYFRIFKNNELIKDVDLSEFIENLLGIGFEDFCKQIFIRQREVSSLIYGQPYQRSEAIDRLLGIDILENIFRSISLKEINNIISNLEKEREYLLEDIKNFPSQDEIERKTKYLEGKISEYDEEIQYLRRKINEYSEIFREMKIKEKRYNELRGQLSFFKKLLKEKVDKVGLEKFVESIELMEELEKIRDNLVEKLNEEMFTERANVLKKTALSLENIYDFLSSLRESLGLLRSRCEFLKSRLYEMMNEMMAVKTSYSEKLARINNLKDELLDLEVYVNRYRELTDSFGTILDIEKRIKEKELEKEALEKKIREEDCKKYILGSMMRRRGSEKEEVRCPICGNQLNFSTIKELEKGYGEEIHNIRSKLNECITTINFLRKISEELRRLKRNVERYEDNLSEKSSLEEELNTLYDRMKELEELIEDVRHRISDLERFVYLTERRLEAIKDNYDILKKKSEVEDLRKTILKVKEELDNLGYEPEVVEELGVKLNEMKDKMRRIEFEKTYLEKEREREVKLLEILRERLEELKNIEERIRLLNERKERIGKVKNAFRIVQRELRKKMLEKIVELMNSIFSKVYVYTDYKALNIKIKEEKGIREGIEFERSIYTFYAKRTADNNWIPVLKKMSEGQKNIVALAFLIALFKVFPHKVMFIILDEPVPNVDKRCRESLIKMISEVGELKQVIIATQDTSFIKIVEELKPPFTGCVYSFSHGEKEPLVRKILEKK